MQTLELISFPTCPFVQRAVIILQEKSVAHSVTYIDLKSPPDWFLEISPRGKVPALKTADGPLFESHAICEYIDEITPGTLLPDTAYGRAWDRAWFQLSSEDFFFPMYLMMYASDRKSFDEQAIKLRVSLGRLEEALHGRSWLSGDGRNYGLADVACAPFVMRAADARQRAWFDVFSGFTAVQSWAARLMQRPSTRSSVPESYSQVEAEGLREGKSIWQI